ncbi:hypothetical protein [Allocoleopsis franciscana]|uniref:Uncharacterized protein n=1 Tax=Allocoleopsis franciscana PCC 7113 TaxID=1173027 RepID=K9WD91_9CYAN|nr:hypothetical protein [Allocoleopsis franciscana]AFZ17714.1 hypothetical protein Mic7113_1858 [Allocoleopsis franciscana PCC 7113]
MSLKTHVLGGGTYLLLRQGLGVIISFVGKILSFGKIATCQISIATLARLQGNRERLQLEHRESEEPEFVCQKI